MVLELGSAQLPIIYFVVEIRTEESTSLDGNYHSKLMFTRRYKVPSEGQGSHP